MKSGNAGAFACREYPSHLLLASPTRRFRLLGDTLIVCFELSRIASHST